MWKGDRKNTYLWGVGHILAVLYGAVDNNSFPAI